MNMLTIKLSACMWSGRQLWSCDAKASNGDVEWEVGGWLFRVKERETCEETEKGSCNYVERRGSSIHVVSGCSNHVESGSSNHVESGCSNHIDIDCCDLSLCSSIFVVALSCS